jgi:hypothetical protein
VAKMKSGPKLNMATITGGYVGSQRRIMIGLDLILGTTSTKCERESMTGWQQG